jgi:putative nucleotidyltransferase with HDIG domain
MIDYLKKLPSIHVWLLSILARHRKIEADIRLAAPPLAAQKDTVVTGAAKKRETEDITRHVGILHDFTERGVVEEKIGNGRGRTDLQRAINNLDALPAMPVIAQKLLALKLDTEDGQRMLLVLIEQDPQIAAKILGLANSAMVGASRQIKTVRDAAMLLGVKRVQSVAAGIAIMSLMTKAPAGEFNMQDLWAHSFRIAFAMQGLARAMPAKIRPQDDQIFLVGMLHDIGYLALAFLDPGLSDKLHNLLAAEPERPSLEIEREIMEISHDELGAELARHWNLPEEIIAMLRYHHTPDAAGAAAGQPLVRMINIAEKLLTSYGIIEYVPPDISAEEWEALGIAPSQAEEVKELVDEQAEQAIQFTNSFS